MDGSDLQSGPLSSRYFSVIGWLKSTHASEESVIGALEDTAKDKKRPNRGLLIH